MTGIRDLRKHIQSMPVYMYYFPWKDVLKTELGYRVYCATPIAKVAASSQYEWQAPWYHAGATRLEQERIAQELLESCQNLH
jgi:hypothetical protein